MEGIELLLFELISSVGTAKSCFMEALSEAKLGNFQKANELIKEGNKNFAEGHHKHARLIKSETSGEKLEIGLLLVHAEDQLMSTETIKILCEEIIDLYKMINEKGEL